MLRTVLIVLAIGAFAAGAISLALSIEGQSRAKNKRRLAYCEQLCNAKESSAYMVRKQQIGFGSIEPRCFCQDGTWQVVP